LDNKSIISLLQSTAMLLELHGANPFQVRHYTQAALLLERLGQEFSSLTQEEVSRLVSTNKSRGLIHAIHDTGTLPRWQELMDETPQGVLVMLQLKGLGPKKVRALWQELGIETLSTLLEACKSGKVATLPGFGAKTQALILESLAWAAKYQAHLHYAKAVPYAQALEEELQQIFPTLLISLVGDLRRRSEIVDTIVFLIGTDEPTLVQDWLNSWEKIKQNLTISGPFAWRGSFAENNLSLRILFCAPAQFYKQVILQTGSTQHLGLMLPGGQSLGELITCAPTCMSEAEAYHQAGLPFIPPELREGSIELAWVQAGAPALITMDELQGVLHNHTTYSDGQHSLEVMAKHCKELGYQYIGITDHSQSATYAGGLRSATIQQQNQVIDSLNQELAPFKIFKGIETDILADGSLDYSFETLASFDFTITSIHSGFNMDRQSATARLIKAIKNPFTTILGHLTGRLLLKREGYPIDHKAVIDACATYGVIIEINGNPWRLDLDWRWVHYAIEQNVWLSINPDAHHKDDFHNMIYGVYMGIKGGLTKQHTFNALSREAVAAYFQQRKSAALSKVSRG